jgi:hypothetical protein
VTFDESVVATNIGINGAGATGTFLGNVTAPVNFGADGTMVLGNGTTLTGAVTTTTTNTGTLAFADTGGGSTVTGAALRRARRGVISPPAWV